MSRASIIVGIDMGTHTTRVAVSTLPESGKSQLKGVGVAPTRGVRHGYVINRENAITSLRAAIADAQKNTGVEITEAVLSVGGISLRAEHIATTVEVAHHSGEVTEGDVVRALDRCEDILLSRHTNIRVIHRIPLKYKIDGKLSLGKPVGLSGKKLSLKTFFITAFENHVEDLIDVAHEAGISVIDVAAAPLVASMPVLSYNDRKAGAALVDIGAETLSIVVFEDNLPISLEVFPVGSTDITNDIALGFQIGLDDAEALKKGTLQPSRARKFAKSRVDEIISARLDDLVELIDRHLESIKKSHLLPAGIVVTGGGAHLEMISSVMKNSLKLPVRIAADGIMQQSKRKAFDASWYVAYGLCLYATSDEGTVRFSRPSAFLQIMKDALGYIKNFLKQLLP